MFHFYIMEWNNTIFITYTVQLTCWLPLGTQIWGFWKAFDLDLFSLFPYRHYIHFQRLVMYNEIFLD